MTNAELFKQTFGRYATDVWSLPEDEFLKWLNADVQQKTGHWEMPVQDDGTSDLIYYQVRCSNCGFDLDPQTWHMELHQYGADNYCPNCGARMEVEYKWR